MPNGNKRDPRVVTITDVPTLISDLRVRQSIVMSNSGNAVKLHRHEDFDFTEGFPLADGITWSDDKSTDPYWGICDTGLTSDITVWEVE